MIISSRNNEPFDDQFHQLQAMQEKEVSVSRRRVGNNPNIRLRKSSAGEEEEVDVFVSRNEVKR
jgi:hypothetical protein